MEQTFVMVKPDGVQRGLVGEILSRFEKKGLRLLPQSSASFPKQLLTNTTKSTLKNRSTRA